MEIIKSVKTAAFAAGVDTCAMTRTRAFAAVPAAFGWKNGHAYLDPGSAARSSVPSP